MTDERNCLGCGTMFRTNSTFIHYCNVCQQTKKLMEENVRLKYGTSFTHLTMTPDEATVYGQYTKIKEEIEREKGTIIQEINMNQDNPQRDIWDVFEGTLYADSSLGIDILGFKKTVSRFFRKDF